MNFFEPQNKKTNLISLKNLEIIIMPVVAFDIKGNRLGMGSGCYDRTLFNWKKSKIIRIGIAYDFQLTNKILKKKWDVPLSSLITPTKIWEW